MIQIETVEIVLVAASSWIETHGFRLNNREWASLIWLGIIISFALTKSELRSSLRGIFRAAFAPKAAIVWIFYSAWTTGFVVLTNAVGLWRAVLTKDTVLWGVTAGIVLLIGFTEASKAGFFKRAVLKAIGVIAFLEYLVTLATFPLWMEILLQPLAFIFVVAPFIVSEPGTKAAWNRRSTLFFSILTIIILIHTARTMYSSWTTMEWDLFALRAVWPMMLALWVLILVFALAVVTSYEQAFLRLKWSRGGEDGIWKAKLGLVLALGIHLRWIHEAAKGGTFHVARADSVSAAYGAAKRFKAEKTALKRQEEMYQEDLVRYAGSKSLDKDGRPRDKHEFRETVRALEWLSTCQMGWYRRNPTGYKPDLIERFRDDFTNQGLQKPSGIRMFVSNDGQRWYAWRRTPSGHCFAIGASEGPSNEWRYDGPDPPRDFPGIGPEWGDSPFSNDRCFNWDS